MFLSQTEGADCLPEKAVQVTAEAREHSWEVFHHGKSPGQPPALGLDGAGRSHGHAGGNLLLAVLS